MDEARLVGVWGGRRKAGRLVYDEKLRVPVDDFGR
jgi:hypothetical protein